jgi:hypothetical protein
LAVNPFPGLLELTLLAADSGNNNKKKEKVKNGS